MQFIGTENKQSCPRATHFSSHLSQSDRSFFVGWRWRRHTLRNDMQVRMCVARLPWRPVSVGMRREGRSRCGLFQDGDLGSHVADPGPDNGYDFQKLFLAQAEMVGPEGYLIFLVAIYAVATCRVGAADWPVHRVSSNLLAGISTPLRSEGSKLGQRSRVTLLGSKAQFW
jgi:hypothetical protein